VPEPQTRTGKTLRALRILGGEATTVQVHKCLHDSGDTSTAREVLTALHTLARHRVPEVELARKGTSGRGNPGLWRLTQAGRDAGPRLLHSGPAP
jgi:hypothetical protein